MANCPERMKTTSEPARIHPGRYLGGNTDVNLLGSADKLTRQQTEEGLVVMLPGKKPCDFAYSLKIIGTNLKAVKPDAR